MERIARTDLRQEKRGGPYVTWQKIQLLPESILELGEGRAYRAGGRRFRVTGPGEQIVFGQEPQTLTVNRYPVDFGDGSFEFTGTVDVTDGYASKYTVYKNRVAHWGATGISEGLGPVEPAK